jgi:hypothetical protein
MIGKGKKMKADELPKVNKLKKERVRKPEAELFEDFESCYLAWSNNGAGRRIYSAVPYFILAASELQAIRAWIAQCGSPVEKLSMKDCHKLLAVRLAEINEHKQEVIEP